jgi:hypothetical protein
MRRRLTGQADGQAGSRNTAGQGHGWLGGPVIRSLAYRRVRWIPDATHAPRYVTVSSGRSLRRGRRGGQMIARLGRRWPPPATISVITKLRPSQHARTRLRYGVSRPSRRAGSALAGSVRGSFDATVGDNVSPLASARAEAMVLSPARAATGSRMPPRRALPRGAARRIRGGTAHAPSRLT